MSFIYAFYTFKTCLSLTWYFLNFKNFFVSYGFIFIKGHLLCKNHFYMFFFNKDVCWQCVSKTTLE